VQSDIFIRDLQSSRGQRAAALRDLALVVPRVAERGESLLAKLPEEAHLFKIILTAQERGTIPTQLWTSAYVIFM
jgi:hypothetical protein